MRNFQGPNISASSGVPSDQPGRSVVRVPRLDQQTLEERERRGPPPLSPHPSTVHRKARGPQRCPYTAPPIHHPQPPPASPAASPTRVSAPSSSLPPRTRVHTPRATRARGGSGWEHAFGQGERIPRPRTLSTHPSPPIPACRGARAPQDRIVLVRAAVFRRASKARSWPAARGRAATVPRTRVAGSPVVADPQDECWPS